MNSPLKFAVLITAFSVIWKLVLFHSGSQYQVIGDYRHLGYFLFILLGIFFGIQQFITKSNNVILKEILKTGFKIAALSSVLFGGFIYVYYKWIDIEYLPAEISLRMEELNKIGKSAEEIEKANNFLNLFFTAGNFSSSTLLGFMAIGSIYTLICGPLLKKILLKRNKI